MDLTFDGTRRDLTLDAQPVSYHEAGTGPVLIMLHGSGPGVSAWSNFQHNIGVFAQHFRVVMPDMPGFGLSGLPVLDAPYARYTAAWMERFMDALGISDAVFIGNSMGGAVAAELAALAPARVKRMAIMGSGGLSLPVFGAEPSEGFKRLFGFLENPTREGLMAWLHTMVYDPSLLTEALVEDRWRNAMAEGVIGRMKTIFGSLFDPRLQGVSPPLWTRAQTIKTPTLMLWGRDDRMLPYDQAHLANRQMPDIELHTFARCGHWIQIERKAAFERVALEFLTRS